MIHVYFIDTRMVLFWNVKLKTESYYVQMEENHIMLFITVIFKIMNILVQNLILCLIDFF